MPSFALFIILIAFPIAGIYSCQVKSPGGQNTACTSCNNDDIIPKPNPNGVPVNISSSFSTTSDGCTSALILCANDIDQRSYLAVNQNQVTVYGAAYPLANASFTCMDGMWQYDNNGVILNVTNIICGAA